MECGTKSQTVYRAPFKKDKLVLRIAKKPCGDKLGASNGDIDRAKVLYFTSQNLVLRYLAATMGFWLSARQVLASPRAFGGAMALAFGIVLSCLPTVGFGAGPPGLQGYYATAFPLNENPVSEGGNWINGLVVGLDWSNCATSGGVVQGRQNNGGGPSYNDSTALLTGTWGSNQTVTVNLYKASVVENDWPEVEIRLRSALTAHSCTGYEVLWSLRTDPSCYICI